MHILSEETNAKLLSSIIVLTNLLANAAVLMQPGDSFLNQKLKECWHKLLEEFKFNCIKEGRWNSNADGKRSRKPLNHGRYFPLNRVNQVIRNVNSIRNPNGLRYSRKTIICTGISLGVDGNCGEDQLSEEIKAIISKHKSI